MDIDLARTFLEIVRTGSFMAAAERLHVTQTTVLALRRRYQDVAVRVEVGERASLHEKVEHGVVDAALVHQPDYWPGMQVEQLMEEKLILVRHRDNDAPYVYVDWGADFRKQHDSAWPERSRASVNVDLGPLALQYLLQQGGSGYFRTRVVQPHLESGALERVDAAPEFSYPVYLVYSRNQVSPLTSAAIDILREVAAEQGGAPK